MKSEKMATINDDQIHFSDILITQSLNQTLCLRWPASDRGTSVWRVLKTSLVWFSSQLSWRSGNILSICSSWHHQRMTSVVRDDRDRSGWTENSSCSTRLLYRTQHSYRSSCHYPDPWLKRGNHADKKVNHQQFLKPKHEHWSALDRST